MKKHYTNKWKLAWQILTKKDCRYYLINTLKFADKKCLEGGDGASDVMMFNAKYFHNDLGL